MPAIFIQQLRYAPVLGGDIITSNFDKIHEWVTRVKVNHKLSVSCEAFYVAWGVTDNGRREVLGIFNIPVEGATG